MSDTIDVLYVEDDAADAEFADMALKSDRDCQSIKLHIVTDGEEAAKFLGIDEDETAPLGLQPNMILLDLNIPKIHGKELLRRIRKSERLFKTPVIILSTSNHKREIDETFRLGASGYFVKPSSLEKYRGVFQSICNYWILHGQLPERS